MEKNIKIGMFLNTNHTISEEVSNNSYAVVFDVENRLAVYAQDYEDGDYAALEAHLVDAVDDGFNVISPADQNLLYLATMRGLIKSRLKQLGMKLPKGQIWTKTLHDDCSYFTVDLKKACVNHAMPEDICGILLLVRF